MSPSPGGVEFKLIFAKLYILSSGTLKDTNGHGPLTLMQTSFLKNGHVYDLKSHFATKRAGHPVLRGADRISHKPFEGIGGTHLYHGLSKHSIVPWFLHQKAGVELHRVHISIQALQICSKLFIA